MATEQDDQDGRERRLTIYHAEQTRSRLANKTVDQMHEMAMRTAAQNRCRDILKTVKWCFIMAVSVLAILLWTRSIRSLVIVGSFATTFVAVGCTYLLAAVRAYRGHYRPQIRCPHCDYRLSLRDIPAESTRFPCPGCVGLIKNESRWSQANWAC